MDLGSAYWAEFDTFSAVGCFSVARDLAPDHPSVVQFIEYEASLRQRFPEYFEP